MAGIYDVIIEQGATFSMRMTYRDSADAIVDLTGYTARMQVRPYHSSSKIILERSTANQTITLGGLLGTILVQATSVVTAALAAGTGVYDLELYSPIGTTVRLIEGRVTISPEVTR